MTPAADRMTRAATTFLESLHHEQRDAAVLPFDDHAERTTWYYFPNTRRGLPLRDMSHWQQKLAHRLILSGLSLQAYTRATIAMTLDNTLDVMEQFADEAFRDASLYYVTIFGAPAADATWGFRFEGHHVCLSFTVANGDVVAATPLFLGANPARVRHDGHDISRPFGDAEDLGRELVHALTAEQRTAAIVAERSPVDVVLANSPHPDAAPLTSERFYLPADATFRGLRDEMSPANQELRARLAYERSRPLGISADALSAGQRDLLGRLVAHYADRFADGIGWPGMRDLAGLHFAWAGGLEPGEGHYYRLQGPALLVEYDNTQDHANHVHTVCRHPKNDFGADVLGLHYARDHAAK